MMLNNTWSQEGHLASQMISSSFLSQQCLTCAAGYYISSAMYLRISGKL